MEKTYNQIVWDLEYLETLNNEYHEKLIADKNKNIFNEIRKLLNEIYV